MKEKYEFSEGLLKSKIEIIANRNERFAMIQDEFEELKAVLTDQLENLNNKISKSKTEKNK